MKQEIIDLYVVEMEQIKKRTEIVNGLLKGKINNIYALTTLESAVLQTRMILESIAMATLVVNKEQYSKVRSTFESDWRANRILQQIKEINPKFYPIPIVEFLSEDPKFKRKWENKKSGFLSEDQFEEVYNTLGSWLHSQNPFGTKRDIRQMESFVSKTITEIMELLNSHLISLPFEDDIFFLVHMQEQRDNGVHTYKFKKQIKSK